MATGSDAFSDRTQVARLSLRYLPTDNVDARFVFERARVREDGQLRSCDFDPDPGAGLLGLLALPSEPSLDAPNNLDTFIAECNRSWALGPDRGTSNLPARHDLDTWLTSGTLRWDLGWATLKSITAWRRSESFDRIDFTGADFQYFDSLIKAWTPRANLSFRLNASLMVYGGWSRGYTSRGFNIGAPSISPTADEEKLDSW